MEDAPSPSSSSLVSYSDSEESSRDTTTTTTTPRTADEYLTLGLHHQIFEREQLAIEALSAATSLSPWLGAAHLALATSFANEGLRDRAYDSFERWIESLEKGRYGGVLGGGRWVKGPGWEEGGEARQTEMVEMVLQCARSGEGEGEVDAELQVGLGVLFTLKADFGKAEDCFVAALLERPDDPLLFNRLAVTLTNSGKAEEALAYYNAALELHPGYVRCRANLAVASANLGHYREAAEHLITALTIQESDNGEPMNGVTSYTLWEALNSSLHM
ncbi:TPR-like protein [Meredithblackwellia eburnea MCA 4105]